MSENPRTTYGSRFTAELSGTVTIRANRVRSEDSELDDVLTSIAADHCDSYGTGKDPNNDGRTLLYLRVEAEHDVSGDACDSGNIISKTIKRGEAELEERLDRIELDLDRCIGQHGDRMKVLSEASTDALIAELQKRGVPAPARSPMSYIQDAV